MLTTTMTTAQLRAQYKEDFDQINGRVPYLIKDWRRVGLKRKSFPWFFSVTGTSKNGNDYILRVALYKRSDLKNNNGFCSRLYLRLRTNDGSAYIDDTDFLIGSKAVLTEGKIIPASLHIYTPHLINQYIARYGKADGYKSNAEQFLLRMDYLAGSASRLEGIHGGDYDTLGIIPDGVLLGTCDSFDATTFRTFLTYDMLNNKQQKYVNEIAKCHNLLDGVYDSIKPKERKIYAKT